MKRSGYWGEVSNLKRQIKVNQNIPTPGIGRGLGVFLYLLVRCDVE